MGTISRMGGSKTGPAGTATAAFLAEKGPICAPEGSFHSLLAKSDTSDNNALVLWSQVPFCY